MDSGACDWVIESGMSDRDYYALMNAGNPDYQDEPDEEPEDFHMLGESEPDEPFDESLIVTRPENARQITDAQWSLLEKIYQHLKVLAYFDERDKPSIEGRLAVEMEREFGIDG